MKKKKGFTLVELLVVIAILAILATVSVVGYMGFTKKAQVSNDESLVTQLNTALKADEAIDGKPETPTAMLEVMEENGFKVENLTPTTSQYNIVWNQEENQFALLDEQDGVVYGTLSEKTYMNWKFVDSYVKASEFSIYLTGTEVTAIPEKIHTGLDVGNNTGIIVVNYENTGDGQTVTIRTNGGTLNVNAENDNLSHYGLSSSVDVKAIAPSSYHEYGKAGFISIEKGRVVVEKDAKVITVYATADTATVDNNSGTLENAYAADGITATGNVSFTKIPDGQNIGDIKKDSEIKIVAVAKVGDTYQVSLEAAFTKALSIDIATIDIISDIDMSKNSWKPIDLGYLDNGVINTTCKNLTFNGNNHLIYGLNCHVTSTNNPHGEIGAGASNYYGEGFFGRIGSNVILNINDITFDNAIIDDKLMNITEEHHTSQVAVVVGISSGKTTFNNVNVKNSYVYGGEKVSALIGHSASLNNIINNGSVVNTTIVAYNAFTAQAVGYASFKNGGITINNLQLINNNVSMKTDTIASVDEYAVDENGYVYLNDGDWTLSTATVAYRDGYNVDSTGEKSKITLNGKTQNSYGGDYKYTRIGDKYSIN